MKLKRDEFKAMLKECILELVQEGKLFHNMAPSAPAPAPGMGGYGQGQPSSVSEQAAGGGEASVTPNTRLNEAVKMATNMVSKGNPHAASLYESLIADTARTTLQEQLSQEMGMGGMGMGGMPASPEQQHIDQAQLGLFANKSRWAALAFGKKTTPNR